MKASKKCAHEIIIAQAGFVFAGVPTLEDGLLVLNEAVNIRVFGTKNGLGELALRGKQSETVLDACGVVKLPLHAIIARIECNVPLE